MMRTRAEYRAVLEADRRALGIRHARPRPGRDEVWRFQRALRAVEYWGYGRTGLWARARAVLARFVYHQWSMRLGFTIPPNVFGPGLSIAHRGTIVVNDRARVGANCRLHVCVNIGADADPTVEGAPTLGDNVYIGPGAKLYGPIVIASDIAIAANAAVAQSFEEPGITIGGVPARRIGVGGSRRLLPWVTREGQAPAT